MRPLSPIGAAVTSTRFAVRFTSPRSSSFSAWAFAGSRNEGMGTSPTGGTSPRRSALTSIGGMAQVAPASGAAVPSGVSKRTSGTAVEACAGAVSAAPPSTVMVTVLASASACPSAVDSSARLAGGALTSMMPSRMVCRRASMSDSGAEGSSEAPSALSPRAASRASA